MLIPAVSVVAAITLMPALLATLGARINSVRLLPKRFVDTGHPRGGWWGRWAELGCAGPVPVAAIGLAIVGLLVYSGVQLKSERGRGEVLPRTGDAINGRAALANAGISAGVLKPFVVLVESGAKREPIVAKLRATPGIAAASPRRTGARASSSLIEAFPSTDGASKEVRRRSSVSAATSKALAARSAAWRPRTAISSARVYSNFPYVLGFRRAADVHPARARIPLASCCR